jgi:hypothetical protein
VVRNGDNARQVENPLVSVLTTEAIFRNAGFFEPLIGNPRPQRHAGGEAVGCRFSRAEDTARRSAAYLQGGFPVARSAARRRRLPAALLAVLAGLVLLVAAPSAASGQDVRCRASALRVTTVAPAAIAAEPIRANDAGFPCSRQGADVTSAAKAGGIVAATPRAATDVGPGGPAAAAAASMLDVSLPGLSVQARGLEAAAVARCTRDGVAPAGSSRVEALTVNGRVVDLPSAEAPRTIGLGPLGTITINQAADSGRRALVIDTPAADVVAAEAIAAADAAGCASLASAGQGGGGGDRQGGGGGEGGLCPIGSELDPDSRRCVIRAGASTGDGQADVAVGRPFEGPSGGTVVALGRAQEQFRSACLRGRGPAYAIVGAGGADLVTGTNERDRILGLGGRDRLEGGCGNDCVDGGAGRDVLTGALGADAVHGGAGNDAVNGGSGIDRLVGGAGNDTLNTGFGADRVSGGSGRDSINAATAGPAVRRLNCGSGRDTVRVTATNAAGCAAASACSSRADPKERPC